MLDVQPMIASRWKRPDWPHCRSNRFPRVVGCLNLFLRKVLNMTKQTKTAVVDQSAALAANPMFQLMSSMAALAGGMPMPAQPVAVQATGKKEKKDREPYYMDVEGTETVLSGEVPQSLLDDLKAVEGDKALGSSQRARLVASIKADIEAAKNGPTIVLQEGTDRLLADYPNTRDALRVKMSIPTTDGRKTDITMKRSELLPLLTHASRIAQWISDQAAAGRLD